MTLLPDICTARDMQASPFSTLYTTFVVKILQVLSINPPIILEVIEPWVYDARRSHPLHVVRQWM
jgi:hypothetical protein